MRMSVVMVEQMTDLGPLCSTAVVVACVGVVSSGTIDVAEKVYDVTMAVAASAARTCP
jgi:hypothetical protein